jgi:hypothetical protein
VPLHSFASRSPAGCHIACCRVPPSRVTFRRAAAARIHPRPLLFVHASWLSRRISSHRLRLSTRRCHRRRYYMHGSSAVARTLEGATDAPPTTMRCRLRPTDAPPPLPRQRCTPIAPLKAPSPTSRRRPTSDASRVRKRRRASEGRLLLHMIVVSAPPHNRPSLPT